MFKAHTPPLSPERRSSESPFGFFTNLLRSSAPGVVPQLVNPDLVPQQTKILPSIEVLLEAPPADKPPRKRTAKQEASSDGEFTPSPAKYHKPLSGVVTQVANADEKELKRQRKLLRNRTSAQLSRERKKNQVEALEAQHQEDQATITAQAKDLTTLQTEITKLKAEISVLNNQNLLFFQLIAPIVNAATPQVSDEVVATSNDEVITTSTSPRMGGQ